MKKGKELLFNRITITDKAIERMERAEGKMNACAEQTLSHIEEKI